MNIMKAISATFARFWRWIRETAWVQPLLIVGSLFAVIFSIPKFTTLFQAWGAESASGYYSSFRLSLERQGTEDFDTEADKLTRQLFRFSSEFVSEGKYPSYAEYRQALEGAGVISNYGEKFYLAYVSRDSSASDSARAGFETLEEKWGSTFNPTVYKETFRLHTIFTDDTSTNDDSYVVQNDKKAFSRYLNKWDGDEEDFFSYIGAMLEDTPYKQNASVSSSNYEHIQTPDVDNFPVPTVFLVDFTESAYKTGRYGVCEALFSVTGDNAYDKATLLMNMWNHNNGNPNNPFSENYISK
ncbi:MAG: hypothetical protein SPI58_03655 [Candidatus Enteromonas sp.]|nr:hypothetical protein [Candidatus Enteromonas sp.]